MWFVWGLAIELASFSIAQLNVSVESKELTTHLKVYR